MMKTLNDIKKALDELGKEYENAEGHKKERIRKSIIEEIGNLGESGLSKKKYKEILIEDIYGYIIGMVYADRDVLEKFEKRKNKSVCLSGYLFTCAKRKYDRQYEKDMKNIPIEQENDDGESWSVLENENYADNSAEVIYDEKEKKEASIRSLASLLALMDHEGVFSGRKDNEANREFVRLFYTECISYVCKKEASKDIEIHNMVKNSEAVLLNSIDNDFADHFEKRHCASVEDFELVPYKLNGYFGIAQSPEKELETPFDAKVYITFYDKFRNKKISSGRISQRKKDLRPVVEDLFKKQKNFP